MSELGPLSSFDHTPLDDLPEAMRPAFLAASRGDATWVAQVPPNRLLKEWAALWRAVAAMTMAELEKTPPQARADEIHTAMVTGYAAALDFVEHRFRARPRPSYLAGVAKLCQERAELRDWSGQLHEENERLRAENEALRAGNARWHALHQSVIAELGQALADGRYQPREGTVPRPIPTTTSAAPLPPG